MPCPPTLFAPFPRSRPRLPLPWEPALTQLRTASPADLDALVRAWLDKLGGRGVRLCERTPSRATYQTLMGGGSTATPLRVRVLRRRNRLQAHHVEAFLGHLVQHHVATGILITTSRCTREAERLAHTLHGPTIRLYSGPQWAAELAARRIGIRARTLWGWVLERAGAVRRHW